MKTIKIKFVDFWDNFVPEKSLFFSLLSENYNVVLSEEPDYLFYSVFGNEHLKYNCIKIFYTGENQVPDFNITDYGIGFEIMKCRDRYFRLPNYYLYGRDFRLMEEKHNFSQHDLDAKTDFCSFVYSNNNASPHRSVFFDKLSAYKPISSGGRYNNNVGGPVKDKLEFQTKHKFSIAFENCSHYGYTTEKLVQAFAAKTVPIYWGSPSVTAEFNKASFINAHDYSSFDEVVEAVRRIDNNKEEYLSMLKTPALLEHEINGYEPMMNQLSQFLYHIFDQDLDAAQRYSRDYWGKRYLNNVKRREKAYNRSFVGVLNKLYKNYFWKIRTKNILVWKIDRMIKKFISV